MDYPNVGTIKRERPFVQVLRGYKPGESSMVSSSFPVKTDVTVKSGMVLHPVWNAATNRTEWILGMGATGGYVALDDSNTADVVAADKLVGLSSSGAYEIATGYFDQTDTYAIGDLLTANAAGLVIKADGNDEVILGRVSRAFPDNAAVTTGVAGPTSEDAAGVFVDSGATNTAMLVFETIDYAVTPSA